MYLSGFKPCPFCGGQKLKLLMDPVVELLGKEAADVYCTSCGGKGYQKVWNNRVELMTNDPSRLAPKPDEKETMKVFLVFQTGVYRHECAGVFKDINTAIDIATIALTNERDDYHKYEIIPFSLDTSTIHPNGYIAERPAAYILSRNDRVISISTT